ncbi:hypothetical protein [Intrasporangium sp.]|uniref:hypothetical protein n=1 Tax=Intrasporangium sp. TaxID=1925024 RepID=UPI0033657D64
MKVIRYGVGSALAAVVLGTVLVPAGVASATEGFSCPTGTDTIQVPYAFTADGQPLLAGTVCVLEGTTRFSSLDVEAGWTAQVKSDGSGKKARTDVRFTQTSTGDRVELIYEPGLTRIK